MGGEECPRALKRASSHMAERIRISHNDSIRGAQCCYATQAIPSPFPDHWPFETLKLGEYFALARRAAKIVRETRAEFGDAVDEVVSHRFVTAREREMLIQKAQSIVYLGLPDE